ncbi:MAG: hypothetical protein IPN42_16515 [Methylococcaceae bacterium]|nr:hypothetical protein [Methylococcaceae bacterium]
MRDKSASGFNRSFVMEEGRKVKQNRKSTFLLKKGVIFISVLMTIAPFCRAATSKAQDLVADLRADVNRDGEIYLGKASSEKDDKKGQTQWTLQRGALVLPNLDDDSDRCGNTSAIQNISVTKCNDAADNVINGNQDINDLAPLKLMSWPNASYNAWATISIDEPAQGKARLFIYRQGGWQILPPNRRITALELRKGVDIRLEALDVVRDKRLWDGRIDVIAKVKKGTQSVEDRVRFLVAPMILQSDLLPMKRLYLPGMPWGQDEPSLNNIGGSTLPLAPSTQDRIDHSAFGYLSILDAAKPGLSAFTQARVTLEKLGLLGSAFKAFHDDFVRAALKAHKKPRIVDLSTFEDPWVQDMFEMAYAAAPASDGKLQVMHLAIRSAQPQRFSAKTPLLEVLGPNVGIVEQWADDSGMLIKNGDYSLNSTGNFGTIPPYTYKDKSYPLGRLLYGAGEAWMQTGGGIIDITHSGLAGELELKQRFPDRSFVRMLRAQGVQKPLVIDTAWLAVGHIDEIVAFVPADTERGWKVVVADPIGAWSLLTDMANEGLGATKFLSKLEPWAPGLVPEELEKTVDDVLNTNRLNRVQKVANAKIAVVIRTLKTETGIRDSDIIKVPVLFDSSYFNPRSFTALTPNAANLVVLDKNAVAIAKQHGPLVDGVDIFESAINQALNTSGLKVRWVEDYVQAHGGSGEIHCQSNVLREPGRLSRWWEPRSSDRHH